GLRLGTKATPSVPIEGWAASRASALACSAISARSALLKIGTGRAPTIASTSGRVYAGKARWATPVEWREGTGPRTINNIDNPLVRSPNRARAGNKVGAGS